MTPFQHLTGIAAPLMVPNIDTDILIRIDRLMDNEQDKLGPYCFEQWRYRADGTEDPDFVLNQPPWRDAPILIAGSNFGCGSSREHAVTALMGRGIGCVIASSFGGIFYNNCFQNGVLPIQLSEDIVEELASEAQVNPSGEFNISLPDCTVTPPGSTEGIPFKIDALRRQGLLKGADDLSLILEHTAAIKAFQQADAAIRPWVYLPGQSRGASSSQ